MKRTILTTFVAWLALCFLVVTPLQTVRGQAFFSQEVSGDMTVALSPVRLLNHAQFRQLLLSDEWTKYYLALMDKFDMGWLADKERAVFARQLEKTFAATPPGMNSVFDTIFGNCQAIWLHCNLDSGSLLPRCGEPAVMFVTDFSRVETERLLVSAFAAFGYTSQRSQSDSILAMSKGNVLVWFIDSFATSATSSEKSTFLIGHDLERMTIQKAMFLRDMATLESVNANEGPFLDVQLTPAGIARIRRYFESLSKEDPVAIFSPGVVESSKRTEMVRFTGGQKSGRLEIELTLTCTDESTAKDLAYFVEKSKELFRKRSLQTEVKPFTRYVLFLLDRSRTETAGNRLLIHFESRDDEDLRLLRECLVEWKKRISP